MDGLLVVDKPAGPTSHDVVVRIRRALRERRIGHTGTLDPLATGILPLVLGRATRLARFLSASEKTYEAVVRLGVATDTGDREGTPIGTPWKGPLPTREAIDRALDAFRGQFLQHPPAFSAKKIAGRRSYALARATEDAAKPVPLPVVVSVARLEITDLTGDLVSLTLDCSAGFYVRALAHDLGERLGTGAHLVALRRTRAGDLTLDAALPLETAEGDPAAAAAHVVPLARMLPALPALMLDAEAVRRTLHGRDLSAPAGSAIRDSRFVRLLDQAGDLVAISEPSAALPGFLHRFVVLR